ncbi:MAG: transcription antitermination factor NusB [Chloroflexi bacterium]|nr:transcription antitermination factor NusB [Chloroflexota bacterium]
MSTPRRRARVLAFQALFEHETARHSATDALEQLLAHRAAREETVAFARELVEGTIRHWSEIDAELHCLAPAWPLDQMSRVDKNILRLALYELLFDNRAPFKVAINEAVELAKTFGSENSARFVNGVLGTVAARRAQPVA